ncbi:MAG: hypothetical protein ACK5LS_12000 [Propioniciclava sp.]
MSGKAILLEPGTTHYRAFSVWSGLDLDLTQVMGPGVVVTLELPSVMAGHDILVPPGVRVLDKSFAIMAGNDIHRGTQGDGSNGTLVIKGFLFWAGHDVRLHVPGQLR